MSNSIEAPIDIDFFGGIDIGIDIDILKLNVNGKSKPIKTASFKTLFVSGTKDRIILKCFLFCCMGFYTAFGSLVKLLSVHKRRSEYVTYLLSRLPADFSTFYFRGFGLLKNPHEATFVPHT